MSFQLTGSPPRERGMSFTPWSIHGIAAGRKTMTRRAASQKLWPGDLIWVKEAVVVHGMPGIQQVFGYGADGYTATAHFEILRYAHQCPRWASRISLRVTEVRIEPLQDISEADAIAEGIERFWNSPPGHETEISWKSYETCSDGTPHPHALAPNKSPITSYKEIWISIHGKASWEANPAVAAISFERI